MIIARVKHLSSILQEDFKKEHPGEEMPELEYSKVFDHEKQFIFPTEDANLQLSDIPAGTETLIIEYFMNEITWKELKDIILSPAKETLKVLYLQHDGVIYGDKDDIYNVLTSLDNLKEVHYCGYYANYENTLIDICQELGKLAIPIY